MASAAARDERSFLARHGGVGLMAALVLLVLAASVVSMGTGAVPLPPERVVRVLWLAATGAPDAISAGDRLVVIGIRLPRTLLGLMVGGALAVSGALMQGLFRNPLADPGLAGVSSGAALAAALVIVLGQPIVTFAAAALSSWTGAAPALQGGGTPFALLPLAAFGGGLLVTLLLYALSTRNGETRIATLLLAGVAIGALTGAVTGLLSYISDDRQLRDLTFWSLGSLGGATWDRVVTVAPAILPVFLAVPFLARGLNALALGEAEAFHLGFAVQRIKRATLFLVSVAVGAAVATSGVIGFVGLVVPHLLRLLHGADHRTLLPASALLGGALLVGADSLARTVVAPAELPIGILTAVLGAPFFLWLLLARGRDLSA
ncbi:iron complex transport system permease protein [Pseudochelatococcus lubricantis]|uniref:Iron complex transport system permease protein n=1 Tax=Pseudochelatococcus lubricantis TaxID=1538102 RepID=A0ABX0V1B5_9HYPH|nr:iron ABC transporter permease [Pseudochelatococcus lubricantis]NIJ58991.1 iron complex transport system permease protein [Pseudochelatococcus lubricantis]